MTGLVTVRDKRGNEREVQAAMVKFYRANSASMKWDTVNPSDVIDYPTRNRFADACSDGCALSGMSWHYQNACRHAFAGI